MGRLKGIRLCWIVALLATAVRAELPEQIIPYTFGINVPFVGNSSDLDIIADAGLKLVRRDFVWSSVERQRGVYDFQGSNYDAMTEGCLSRSIKPLYILAYGNRQYEPEFFAVRTEEGRRAFAAFAGAAAAHYAGKGILWEIWNEPNIPVFWRPEPNVDEYCELVKVAAPAIRKGDPEAVILGPAVSGMQAYGWLEESFKRGLLEWIDVVTVHPYRPIAPESVIHDPVLDEWYNGDYDRLRELIAAYAPAGKDIKIISSEWGYSNSHWGVEISDEQQANYAVRQFLSNFSQDIPVSIWYDWRNDCGNTSDPECNFGIMESDLRPKTAFHAIKTFTHTLAGYSFDRRIELDNENDFAFMFRNGGRQAFAVWTREESKTVTLPLETGSGVLKKMLGDSSDVNWGTSGLEIQITQSPQYLLPQKEVYVKAANDHLFPETFTLRINDQRIITVRVPKNAEKATLFNISGRKICEISVSSDIITWNGTENGKRNFQNGVYLLQVTGKNWIRAFKFSFTR